MRRLDEPTGGAMEKPAIRGVARMQNHKRLSLGDGGCSTSSICLAVKGASCLRKPNDSRIGLVLKEQRIAHTKCHAIP